MSGYVLIRSYHDGSGGLQHAWGPFPTEDAAKATRDELHEIGLYDRLDIRPLRDPAPILT